MNSSPHMNLESEGENNQEASTQEEEIAAPQTPTVKTGVSGVDGKVNSFAVTSNDSSQDKSLEKEFAAKQRPRIYNNLRILSYLTAFFALIFAIVEQATANNNNTSQLVHFALMFVIVPVTLIAVAHVCPSISCFPSEIVATVAACIAPTVFIFGTITRTAFLMGENVGTSFSGIESVTSDSPTIAVLCVFLTAVHHMLPVRCTRLWPVTATVPIIYAAMSLPLESQTELEGDFMRRLLLSSAIFLQSFICLMARASSEMLDRYRFMIEEKGAGAAKGAAEGACNDSRQMEAQKPNGKSQKQQPSAPELRDMFAATGRARSAVVFAPPVDEKPASILQSVAGFGAAEHWLIEPNNLEMFPDLILGWGGFGAVAAGRLHGNLVAVKMSLNVEATGGLRSMVNELRVLRRIRHPNIVAFHGACIEDTLGELMLIQELVTGPSLRQLISCPPDGPDKAARWRIMLGICKGIQYMHRQYPPILHGDLKPPNILFQESSFEPKLCDFGLARVLHGEVKTLGSTARWAAPEMVAKKGAKKPTTGADIFSVGRIAYFVVTGLMPLDQLKADAIKEKLRSWDLPPQTWPKEPVAFQTECQELCEQTLKQDPSDRPSIEALHTTIWHWYKGGQDGDVTKPSHEPGSAPEKQFVRKWLLDTSVLPPEEAPLKAVPWQEGLKKIRAALTGPKKKKEKDDSKQKDNDKAAEKPAEEGAKAEDGDGAKEKPPEGDGLKEAAADGLKEAAADGLKEAAADGKGLWFGSDDVIARGTEDSANEQDYAMQSGTPVLVAL
eukprot:TRINITY_DN9233_c0_g1_i1.p1 TRINITY_DN9233_c0_g1~~TRINITY_DN9233_c0_g1_i1.p1  ORF type:complete len:783 (-),score=171.84 TRINITY_DN9233_c0_g1_i1:88-2436(-)